MTIEARTLAKTAPAGNVREAAQNELSPADLAALAAVSDGNTDATPVFERILARLRAGASIVLPEGRFRIVRTLSLPPIDLSLRGAGMFSTYLIMDFPSGSGNFIEWINIQTTPARAGIEVSDLSLVARSVQSEENRGALYFSYANRDVFTETVKVSRVRISPDFSIAAPAKFNNGLVFDNVRQGYIESSWIFGLTDNAPSLETMGKNGVLLFNECTDFRIVDSIIFQWQTGVVVQGTSEGLQLYHNSIVYSGIGLAANNPGEPGIVAAYNNFNTGVAGMILLSPLGAVINGNTFYMNDETPRLNPFLQYVAVDIRQGHVDGIEVESRNNQITNNILARSGGLGGKRSQIPFMSGINLVSRIKTTVVSGNSSEDLDGPLIWLGGQTHHNIVTGNIGERNLPGGRDNSNDVLNQGTGNLLSGNLRIESRG